MKEEILKNLEKFIEAEVNKRVKEKLAEKVKDSRKLSVHDWREYGNCHGNTSTPYSLYRKGQIAVAIHTLYSSDKNISYTKLGKAFNMSAAQIRRYSILGMNILHFENGGERTRGGLGFGDKQ